MIRWLSWMLSRCKSDCDCLDSLDNVLVLIVLDATIEKASFLVRIDLAVSCVPPVVFLEAVLPMDQLLSIKDWVHRISMERYIFVVSINI